LHWLNRERAHEITVKTGSIGCDAVSCLVCQGASVQDDVLTSLEVKLLDVSSELVRTFVTAIVFDLFYTVNHNTKYLWSLMLAVFMD